MHPSECFSTRSKATSLLVSVAQQVLTPEEARERWADISLYDKNPLAPRLSGLSVEYRILAIYSHDSGQRSAKISFNVGQGTQDIGFRNELVLTFNILPAKIVGVHILDEKGQPATAAPASVA